MLLFSESTGMRQAHDASVIMKASWEAFVPWQYNTQSTFCVDNKLAV
jgi:hypothetical protein